MLQGSAVRLIYTRQRTESSVNHIHSIRHYNHPKYNSQLVALEPLGDMAWINNAQQSNVSSVPMKATSMNLDIRTIDAPLSSELTQYRDDITFLTLHLWNGRESSRKQTNTYSRRFGGWTLWRFICETGFCFLFTFQSHIFYDPVSLLLLSIPFVGCIDFRHSRCPRGCTIRNPMSLDCTCVDTLKPDSLKNARPTCNN